VCLSPKVLIQQNHKYMQEIKLQPSIQEVLRKNTYNSPRNDHANPTCNTFLQEKHHKMPKMSSFNKCASLDQPNTQDRVQIADLLMDSMSNDEKMKEKILHLYNIMT
jgi:hypothetical protein